jgi:hypothetical protein
VRTKQDEWLKSQNVTNRDLLHLSPDYNNFYLPNLNDIKNKVENTYPGTMSDLNDRYSVTVLELPF